MSGYRFFLASALILLAVVSCRWSSRENSNTRPSEAPVATTAETEAKDQLKRYLLTHLTPCDDSWVVEKANGMDGNGIFEYKNPSIIVRRVGQVSEADRLNGVQWYGLLAMDYSAYRRYFENQWTQWKNDHTAEWDFQVSKGTNGWSVDERLEPRPGFDHEKIYARVDCDKLPN